MTPRLALRRLAVTAGVVLSLLLGVATIRAASDWTATNAPLEQPVSAQELGRQLAVEQARSVDLAARLDAVTTQTAALNVALGAAAGQVVADQATADDLKARLEAAQKKLKAVNKQIARATARLRAAASAPAPAARSAPAATPAHEVEDDD
jgi:chromosome segregation ATPase